MRAKRNTPPGPPRAVDALVLDAAQRQSLVAVRSLGRAGLRVGVADWKRAPAFESRWATFSARVPDAQEDQDAFATAVGELVDSHGPRVVLVAGDGTIDVLRARRDAIASRIGIADEPALEIATDKVRTSTLAQELGIASPRTVVVRTADDLGPALDSIPLPAVVKPARSWASVCRGGSRVQAVVVTRLDEARAAAEVFLEKRVAALFQEWIGGRREAVSLLRTDGRFAARFAQIAYRTAPPLGGSFVVRESIALPPDTTEAAEALVDAMGLEGYAEVEFRRDAAGRPFLMEVNPRLNASVEVAVRAGVDFPRALYEWAAGGSVRPVNGYRLGVRLRWLGGDVHWLVRTLKSRGKPDSPPPLEATAVFIREFFRRSGYDYLVWSDMRPAATACRQFVVDGVRSLRDSRKAQPR